jgi:hypothetical protein
MLTSMTVATTMPAPERRRSRLVREADAFASALLLTELTRLDWCLTAVAASLELSGPSHVLHAIKHLGLSAQYDEARRTGKVSPGNRVKR